MSNLFVTDEEALSRLKNPNNTLVVFKENGSDRGPEGTFEQISPELRVIIGSFAKATSSLKAAEVFNVAPSTANKASRGEINHGKVVPEIKDAVDKKALGLREKGTDLIDKLLGLVDNDDRLNDLSPSQQIGIAAQTSTIVKNLSKDDGINLNFGRTTFIIEKPGAEVNYETVDAITVDDENSISGT